MDGDSQDGSMPEQFEEQQDEVNQDFVVPNDRTKLKACARCSLLKTEQQWKRDSKCQNCGPFDGDYTGYITKNYEGMVCLMNPQASWIRKKLRNKQAMKLVPGAYALNCTGH